MLLSASSMHLFFVILYWNFSSGSNNIFCNILGCFDEYFKLGSDKEIHDKVGDGSASILACKIVINSKSNDEALVINSSCCS